MKNKSKKILITTLSIGIITATVSISLFKKNNTNLENNSLSQIAYLTDTNAIFQQKEIENKYEESLLNTFGITRY